ncbi:MAG: glycine zipper domain-containing protein [Ginsengibacter sp.]
MKFFKTSLLFFTLILLLAACKNRNTADQRNIQLLTDTSAYRHTMNSDTAVIIKQEQVNGNEKASANTGNHSSSNNEGSASSGSTTTPNSTNNNTSSSSDNANKGWSKAAKGAVIGGAAGAVGGAVISKKAGGAAIGAAVGAASGYIIGRDQDKQDGRVKKKKKQ